MLVCYFYHVFVVCVAVSRVVGRTWISILADCLFYAFFHSKKCIPSTMCCDKKQEKAKEAFFRIITILCRMWYVSILKLF